MHSGKTFCFALASTSDVYTISFCPTSYGFMEAPITTTNSMNHRTMKILMRNKFIFQK